jgi:hypothetical protein
MAGRMALSVRVADAAGQRSVYPARPPLFALDTIKQNVFLWPSIDI